MFLTPILFIIYDKVILKKYSQKQDDDPDKALQITHEVKEHHPSVKVAARAFDRGHAYALDAAGADHIITETYFSALELGKVSLEFLGMHPYKAENSKERFAHTESKHHVNMMDVWKKSVEENKFDQNYIELFIELEKAIQAQMKRDRHSKDSSSHIAWKPPPKDYQDDFL